MWWKKKLDLAAEVYFPGTLSPSLEGLTGLSGAGVEVEYRGCQGELFWRTVDSPDSPALIDATMEALQA